MRFARAIGVIVAVVPSTVVGPALAQTCTASATSLTPASWRVPARAGEAAPMPGLSLLREIPLPGPANRFDYQSFDPVTRRNQMVAIDPVTEKIVERYDLAGSAHPQGFVLDEEARLLFMSSEESAPLQVIDLRTMQVLAQHKVGDGPDVLAWDPDWRRLYVASEGGVLSAFWLDGTALKPVGEIRAPHAHTVSVDPRTHRVYLPLENVNGKPVLRIYTPAG